MPIELRVMDQEPPVTKVKLALVGKEKHGKSRTAATGRKPVLFHDFDNRAEALQGIPGVYVISYVDPQWPKFPEAAQKFLDVVSKLEDSLDLSKLGFKVPEGTLVRNQVVDSIQTFGKAFQNYALSGQKDIRREITFGGMKVFLPGGWDAWNAEMVPVENSILRLLAMPSDTTIILHEIAEEAGDSTAEKPRYTGKIGVYPARYQRLVKYFNEVWRVHLTSSVDPRTNKQSYLPKVYPLPTYEFDAATVLNLDAVEEPNIEAMIAKHESRVKGLLAGTQPKALLAGVKI
jgi:hypothetical protein